MYFIKKLLSETGLIGEQSTSFSIACISTTRPIYLVFNHSSAQPTYVVRELSGSHAWQANHVHNRLFQLVGNLVPEPIGVYEYSGKTYDIQRGVKGAPWFQIRSKIATENDRAHLEKRIWQTLNDFQSAIYSKAEATTLQPCKELNKAYLEYQATGAVVGDKLKSLIGLASNSLLQGKNCPALPQHGDFCLNNMIVDSNHITVIDFEDFEITKMPMYDHFTLALSLPSRSTKPADAAEVFNRYDLIKTAHHLGIPETDVKWHFFHHLLLRLGPWSNNAKRSAYRTWLSQVLDCFIEHNYVSENTPTSEKP